MKGKVGAIRYHEETKHHPQRMARSLGYMDWANQPNPFRRFEDASLIRLALGTAVAEDISYARLLRGDLPAATRVTLEALSDLLEHSLALSAWKAIGDTKWALRINPSSGNLHPTEGYLILDAIDGISQDPGVYHYAPKEHALEMRCSFPTSVWRQLVASFPADTYFVGLTSIHWREAWKYGERAYRYCQHDVGHALAAISLAAALQGRRAIWLADLTDDDLSRVLGLDRRQDFQGAEHEHPDLLLALVPAGSDHKDMPRALDRDAIEGAASATWRGQANRLSNDHVPWPLIDEMEAACRKEKNPVVLEDTETADARFEADELTAQFAATGPGEKAVSARAIIKQRRSAVDMDGKTRMSAPAFYHLLTRTLPTLGRCPWWSLHGRPRVHLCLFVHLIDDIAPGLYFLVRAMDSLGDLKHRLNPQFTWKRPAGCPDGLALFELASGDVRRTASVVSCQQAIAAYGAFSLGMIAEFEEPLRHYGDWYYRRLFWESGMIGQILYLEAEAIGLRGTGIGCYFDDEVHRLLGLRDHAYQSLYHFTIGGPVEDTRLTTLPPYESGNPSH